MAPPSYSDLGKAAKDLSDKGYNFGLYKLECKTKSSSGVEFTTKGSSSHDSGKVSGSLETKYKLPEHGLTFVEKWNTDNVLATEITIEDQLCKGLKLAFESSFAPQTGKKNGQIKTAYKMDYLNASCDVDFDFAGPTVHGAAVVGYNNFLAGYQMSFDTSKSKLSKNNFAFGYSSDDMTLHCNINDGAEFGGSVYNKVNSKLQTGVNLSWSAGNSSTRLGLAAKYTLDKNSYVNMKVNNAFQIGMGYTQNIRDGVKLNLSSLIEGKNFNQGGHKVGMGLEFDV
ncbi:voltage-dependent anion-selective channel protein 2-like [Argopecten irradians]|uniref:voltage-dependent anion-selective channel protein 2-like n=1 Tax=Argopecten irradians TaxID=31199 RepID=UPI00371F3F85